MDDKPSAAEQAFEEAWTANGFSNDIYNRCKHFYLLGDAAATERTARRCVEICDNYLGQVSPYDAKKCKILIAKEFGLE